MAVNVNDLTVTSIDTLSCFDITGKSLLAYLDELQNVTISHTEEKEDITGKNGRKLSSLKRNKGVTISGTNGLLSAGLLAIQVGSEFEAKESTPVKWDETVTVTGGKATLTYKAVGAQGSEIMGILVRNLDGTIASAMEQAASAAAGKFAYDPQNKEITFNTDDVPDGTEVVVFYMRNIKGSVLVNSSEVFSMKCQVYSDFEAEDKCGNVFHGQFFFPKADFSGEFDIEVGDSQAVHNFEAEALAGACGKGGTLWTYTIFNGNGEDAA